MTTLRVLTISWYVAIAFGMQLYANDRVQFEAASVKQTSQCTYESSQLGPGSVALKGVPLKPVLMTAFKVGQDQIIGPSWLESDCFEVFAKLPQGSTTDQIPMMLQALLAERFKLSAHKENRVSTGYTLIIDKNGPKLKESKEDSTFMAGHPRGTRAVRRGGGGFAGVMTMEALAKALSRQVDGPVVDATGLKGEFEIELSWSAGPQAAEPGMQRDGAASTPMDDLFSAVRESLGLKLEARKTQVEFLVIDHIERVPTAN
jgi:uncharacterized protein (TIGR03435 family)